MGIWLKAPDPSGSCCDCLPATGTEPSIVYPVVCDGCFPRCGTDDPEGEAMPKVKDFTPGMFTGCGACDAAVDCGLNTPVEWDGFFQRLDLCEYIESDPGAFHLTSHSGKYIECYLTWAPDGAGSVWILEISCFDEACPQSGYVYMWLGTCAKAEANSSPIGVYTKVDGCSGQATVELIAEVPPP